MDSHSDTSQPVTSTTRAWGTAVACINQCELSEENPLLDDGYCQGCHDYPEGS